MTKRFFAIVGAGLFALGAQAQQAASNAPQPQQIQTLPVPCQIATAPAATKKSTNSQPTFLDKLKKKANDKIAAIGVTSGIPMPTVEDLKQLASTNSAPCPPAKQAVPPTPTPKPPSDAVVSLRCNPLVLGPKGVPGASTGFTLPDPSAYGIPAPGTFTADAVVPDATAKTPCYLIRTDPTTKRVFVAQ